MRDFQIAGEEEILRGALERITYVNEENGYSVFKIAVKDEPDLVTAVGCCETHMPGEDLELYGQWSEHPKFGRQFSFTLCRSLVPSTVDGIKRYLGSGLVKGVGPKMAERIVDMFGDRTLDVLDESPDDLLKVKGLSPKLLDSIKQSWESQKEIRSIMLFLQSNGISPGFAAKIYKKYEQDTIQVVKENPYRLADDIFGIGFISADKVATKMGVAVDSSMRLEAGVQYVMSELTGEGHIYAPRALLALRSAELLGVSREMTDSAIGRAIESSALVGEKIFPDDLPDGDDSVEAIYLPPYYVSEAKGARMIAALMRGEDLSSLINSVGGLDIEREVKSVQDTLGIKLAANQISAVRMAMCSKVMIITGGPGTGKTTLIKAIIEIWGSRGLTIQLAAPTGRAAKRMAEATGHEAMTIHRMLEYKANELCFSRNSDYPLECDLLIVDEASMIDSLLMFHLLRAIPESAHLILVGDINQLPSVGPGNVLKDLISSGVLPVVELNEIFRQAQTSGIITNAHRVNSGLAPLKTQGDGLRDFYIVYQDDPGKCVDIILALACDRIPKRFGLDPIEEVQVLTPMHRGALGASNLNVVLQRALNVSGGRAVEYGGKVYRTGDKVMQIRNNYDKDVYNGDIGFILRADPDAGMLTVKMDEREIEYGVSEFNELVHAYAVSIHKSQGSEYKAVIIPVHTQHYIMLQRNLLYTGITRGKELVVLVGTARAMEIAAGNDETKRRYTHMGVRLRDILASS
ncbi:MAG: ATP-dependent RecD-like DNA helicase [Synergistaceae bacterium]|nr:ATP-dependent RecD-like DNA helicase [Synergistaceae bacterium]